MSRPRPDLFPNYDGFDPIRPSSEREKQELDGVNPYDCSHSKNSSHNDK